MTRRVIASMVAVGFVCALAWTTCGHCQCLGPTRCNGTTYTPKPEGEAGLCRAWPMAVRDTAGVWWGGADVGAARGRGGARGGGARGGARGTPPPTFMSLYKPEAAAKAKTLSDKDDPTLRCRPTAFGTLNVGLYDVGAVGQIISTPKMVVMLTETYHGFRLVPTDGRPHPDDVPPRTAEDSIGHWESDTFVVDTTNFTDNTWMSAEGRVSPHSDALHIVERYRRVDARHARDRSDGRRSRSADRALDRAEADAGARTIRPRSCR